MRKTFLFILALCATIMAWGTPKSGLIDGTYYIASKTDLENFATAVNGGQYSLNAVVTADIDMAHEQNTNSWTTPIGTLDHPYTGTFDGQCYEIKNFLIFRKGSDLKNLAQIGFFGAISGATIKNIILSSSLENNIEDVSGCLAAAQAGILVGLSGGSTIDNCQVSANLFTNVGVNVGGIVGSAGTDAKDIYKKQNTISRCSCAGTWRIRGKSNYGGIVGYSYYSTIENCYNLTILPLNQGGGKNNDGRVGGILGYVNVSSTARPTVVKNCYNYGKVSNETTNTSPLGAVGAIAGRATGSQVKFINCYYLSTSCDKVCGQVDNDSKNNVTATSKSAEEFKSLAASLGDEFVDGTDYPVFAKLTPALAFTESAFEVNTEETSIENSLVGLVADAYPNFGTLTYEMTGDAIGALVSGTPNVELNGTAGTATVTASVAGSDYYAANETFYTITVVNLPSPELSFADGDVSKDMNASGYVNTLTNKGDGEVSYSSSNEMVATVANNGTITIIGTGTTTITASSEKTSHYLAGEASYTLTVTEPTGEEAITETFSQIIVKSSWVNKDTLVHGDNDIYQWKLYHFRKSATELRTGWNATNNYIAFDGEMEGGIKRVTLSFKPQEVNTLPANINIDNNIDGEGRVLRQFHLDVDANNVKKMEYSTNLFIKKNSGFRLQVPITETKTSSDIWYYSVKITPYLLYTKKEVEVEYNSENLTSYDATQNLINNTDEPPTIALSGTNVQAQLDGDGKTINLENVTEDVTVTASWNEGKVTTTFTLKVKKERITPDFTYNTTEVNKTLLDGAFTNTLTMTEGCGTVVYTSSNENVAKVDENGEVTIRTAGTTTITATLTPAEGYKEVDPATYTLNVAKGELGEAWKEGFGVIEVIDGFQKKEDDIEGDEGVYNWKVSYYQRNSADVINEEKALRLRYDKDVANHIEFDGAQEGGIKAIAFDWKMPGDGSNLSTAFDVTVNGEKNSFAYSGLTSGDVQNYAQVFNVRKNTTFELEVPSTGSSTIFGPISIIPYLLYKDTVKSKMFSEGSYINSDLINNTTGGDLTFSSSDPKTAYIETSDDLHKDKVVFMKTGRVTITATWIPADATEGEEVTTSYILIIESQKDVEARFRYEDSKFEKVLSDAALENEVIITASEEGSKATYSSSNDEVASVDENGKVTYNGIGTAVITASIAETATYKAWEKSYTVVVRTGIDESKKLVECFSQITSKNDNCTAANTSWKGDVTDWKVYNTRRYTNDTINGNNQATFIRYKGYAKAEDIEGGVKYFSFNWKQWASETGTMKMTASIGGNAYSQEFPATDVDKSIRPHYYFAWNVGCKKNTGIEVKNESYNDGGLLTSNGRITFDAFEIVPYLFYKTKYHKMDVANGGSDTWINEDLINNTEDGAIVYSIEDIEGKDVAEINTTSGQVTAKSNGKAKVTATWTPADAEDGEVVTTTYEVEVFYSKLEAELAFDPEEITVGVNETTITTPTLINPHELTVKYSSFDEDIATVNETTGEVTLKHVAGDVIISATSEETDTYQVGNASYTIHVLPLPDVTFPNLTGTDNIKTVDMDQVPFTETIWIKVNEEDVTSSAAITYESSNEEVATIIQDSESGEYNKVSIIGVGTATITAKIDQTETYAGRDVYYTLTVEDNTPAEKQWTETFSSIGNVTDYITKRNPDIVGDSSIYSWAMRNYRRRQTQADSLATEQAIRLSNANNNYIETLNNQEGGIKRISFNWRTPGTEAGQLPINLNVSVCYNNYQDTVKRPMTRAKSKDNMTDNSYCSNFFVKQNAKLKIDIADETYSVMLIGPITITPYLLYTKKEVPVTYDLEGTNTVNASANLINNLEEGETVTYSLSEGAQAQIDGSTITLANATEEVIVTATWGEVSTTFTLKVTKAEDPIVEPDFILENKAAGALATICLPNKIDRIENGTLYSISYGDKTSIEFVEANYANDDAGMPYLVQVAEAGDVNFFYIEGEPVEKPVDAETAKGFVGKLADDNPEEPIYVPSDGTAILVSGGQLRVAGTNCVLTKNHAYIDATKLPTEPEPVGAPRRTIRLYNPDAAPTNFNGLNGAVKPMKVLRDGQFYIIRDTKTYNAQGILVE